MHPGQFEDDGCEEHNRLRCDECAQANAKLERFRKIMCDDNDDEFLKFERIKNPRHRRPDICAFLLLDELCPGKTDMVSAAVHDQIYLDIEPSELAKVATEEQLADLRRCGVMYDEDTDSLSMFA